MTSDYLLRILFMSWYLSLPTNYRALISAALRPECWRWELLPEDNRDSKEQCLTNTYYAPSRVVEGQCVVQNCLSIFTAGLDANHYTHAQGRKVGSEGEQVRNQGSERKGDCEWWQVTRRDDVILWCEQMVINDHNSTNKSKKNRTIRMKLWVTQTNDIKWPYKL